MKTISFLFVFVMVAWVVAPNRAQAASGFYVSGDLGVNIASGIDTTGFSNDRASACDEFINPNYATVPNCTDPNRGGGAGWDNTFNGATGILAGGAIGYSFSGSSRTGWLSGFRVEAEYFYRQSNYDETSDVPAAFGATGDKLAGEIVRAIDRIGSVTSHNLFGNLLYDFRSTSRFTPYIGVGGGLGLTDMEYGSVWARNPDPANIATGEGLPNQDDVRRNLAGTVSVAQKTLSDTLYGLQLLFGVDYALTEATSLGLKGRWVKFNSFSDRFVWDPLRSHEPNVRLDGSEPVHGWLNTSDLEFFGVSLNMKYRF